MVNNINPSSDTKTIIKAMTEISAWLHKQAAEAKDDSEYWQHSIRALALDEAIDRMGQLQEEIYNIQSYRDLVIFIANDYHELSFEKAEWQRTDWKKRAEKLIQKLENR